MNEGTPAAEISAEISRFGSISFSRFQTLALYGAGGFYEGGGAGRHRDFLTSPEVGPLFGAVVARRLDTAWRDLGCPDPFVVIEVGAGPGALAVSVIAADPDCALSLRYVMVDRSAAQRNRHGNHLGLVPAAEAFANAAVDEHGEPHSSPARGPLVVSLERLPRNVEAGVVFANELLDNLPVDVLERNGDRWLEVRVALNDDGGFEEQLAPATAALSSVADRLDVHDNVKNGQRIPIQVAVSGWITEARTRLDRGSVIAIDYARSTSAMACRPMAEWLRTYQDHTRGSDALTNPGSADITCDVATDQVGAANPPTLVVDQATWLRSHGIEELVDDGRRLWAERAAVGDLEAIKARSRVGEAEALTDPAGLGAFTVFEWNV